MASQGPRSPGTMADDSAVGNTIWSDVDNAKVSDNNYSTIYTDGEGVYDTYVKIVKADGSIGTTNKAKAEAWDINESYYSYGANNDLWGESWTAANINDADFGVVLSIYSHGYYPPDYNSHYLKATNFGFSIPAGATINGIIVEIERNDNVGTVQVDHIRITVYYTEAATGTNCQINIGDVWKSITAIKINIGDVWKDVAGMKINIGDVWKTVF